MLRSCSQLKAHRSQLFIMTELLGHLHPVLVHLPIGILLLACVFQLLSAKEKYSSLRPAVGLSLFWGMIMAIASCISGYLLSGSGDYDEELVSRHQWFGITVAAGSVACYLLYRYQLIHRHKWIVPTLLIALIAITGHLGGSLTHGSDYLTGAFKKMSASDTVVVKKPIANVQEAIAYTDIIEPLLQSKCYSCHGATKQKGKLRMDQADLLMKGGKDGVVIEAGKAAESELIKRIMLDKADEHHMPPKEKPQPTEKEIALLHWWIATGASFTKKTKDLPQPAAMATVLASLQNTQAEKKQPADVPLAPVAMADDLAVKKLKDLGVVIIPISASSHYLSASFVNATRFTDKDMPLLLPLKKQLIWLKMSHTNITDAGMDIIAQCTNLSRLQLDSTGITDKGLATLSHLTQLQQLNLVNTKITASGLLALKKLEALRSVYVYKTGSMAADWITIKPYFARVQIDTGGYQVPLLQTDTSLVKPPAPPVVK